MPGARCSAISTTFATRPGVVDLVLIKDAIEVFRVVLRHHREVVIFADAFGMGDRMTQGLPFFLAALVDQNILGAPRVGIWLGEFGFMNKGYPSVFCVALSLAV